MEFVPFWFILITVLWTGFFILEGFDLGVGMLHGFVAKDDAGRRAVINTIGPLWDGNEVWLVVAGAAMFAAFPDWYATMFSAFYLALVVLLCALILRGVSFEYRGKSPDKHWRGTWSTLLSISSLLVPLVIGVALGDLLHGLPVNSAPRATPAPSRNLFQPYALHHRRHPGPGSASCTARRSCALQDRRRRARPRLAAGPPRWRPSPALPCVAFVSWTHVTARDGSAS